MKNKIPLLILLGLVAFWPLAMDGQVPSDIIIEFRIPSTVITRVESAFAESYHYQEVVPNPAFDPNIPKEIPNPLFDATLAEDALTNPKLIPNPAFNPSITAQIPNPESKRAFLKRMISAHIQEVTLSYEIRMAQESGTKVAREKAEKEIKIP